jgi:hypothetical protein
LTLAQRAFAAAEILALAAALIFLFFAGFADLTVLAFAHRAFWAATILARPTALILRFFGALADNETGAPRIEASSLFNVSIFSFRPAARRSWTLVNDDNGIFI